MPAHRLARPLAAALLLALPLAPALAEAPAKGPFPALAPAPAPAPVGNETDDEALEDIQRAVKARDAAALVARVGGAGVEGSDDKVVSTGWIRKYMIDRPSAVQDWVFGPKAPPKGQPAPWSMAACLAGKVQLRRTAEDAAEVTCSAGGRQSSFGLSRHQGRWAITRDFFWPSDGKL